MTNYYLPSQNVTVNLMTKSLACEQEHKRVRRGEIGVANIKSREIERRRQSDILRTSSPDSYHRVALLLTDRARDIRLASSQVTTFLQP